MSPITSRRQDFITLWPHFTPRDINGRWYYLHVTAAAICACGPDRKSRPVLQTCTCKCWYEQYSWQGFKFSHSTGINICCNVRYCTWICLCLDVMCRDGSAADAALMLPLWRHHPCGAVWEATADKGRGWKTHFHILDGGKNWMRLKGRCKEGWTLKVYKMYASKELMSRRCSFLLMRWHSSGRCFLNQSPSPLQHGPLSSQPGFPRAKSEKEERPDRRGGCDDEQNLSRGKDHKCWELWFTRRITILLHNMTQLLLFQILQIFQQNPSPLISNVHKYWRTNPMLHLHWINVSMVQMSADINPLSLVAENLHGWFVAWMTLTA